MNKILSYLSYLLLALIIGFNLYLYYPETKILADPNDNIFQYSLLQRTNWVWENYHCPFSFSCLPNLTDHVVTVWAEGYPLPVYYSHIPQIVTVSSYQIIIKPLIAISHLPITLYQHYNWTKYLLLCFFPLSVFFALRLVGFNPILSVFGAFFASHFSTDGLYGIDPPSFLWRGYGLTSQLYAQIFMPLAIAFTYRALKNINSKLEALNPKQITNNKSPNTKLFGIWNLFRISDKSFAILFLTLTTSGHLGVGIITFISLVPFVFIDLNPRQLLTRMKTLALICLVTIGLLSYWIVPAVLGNNYHLVSFWDPIWKFDSYGWYEVIRQYLSGEIFDWQRMPVITILATIGFFALIVNTRLFPFALLFAFWVFMYFGRTTWGSLIDLIPAMKDFHQHRFLVGIQMAAIFLIPGALDWIFKFIELIITKIVYLLNVKIKMQKESDSAKDTWKVLRSNSFQVEGSKIISIIFFVILILPLAYFTVKQTVNYNTLNTRWIGEANKAYRYDEKNFQDLTDYLNKLPQARIYAGRPGNWGRDFRLGSTQMYMNMAIAGFDVSQFLPETWSPMSENEQNFDERTTKDYDLLNIRYIITDTNHDFPSQARLEQKFGPFEVYQIPTTGWFDIVTTPMMVKTDKTNFLNLVYYWHRSYTRLWKMHPLISVEKNPSIPPGVQKVIRMMDEVSYEDTSQGNTSGVALRDSPDGEGIGERKNIFSDFPFVFPEATISAYLTEGDKDTWNGGPAQPGLLPGGGNNTAIISNEKIDKQIYSATIQVPDPCPNCFTMFKMSYHPNWQVKVDGKEAQKYSVFPFYLATPITPGTHDVEFYYQPGRLKVALIVLEIILIPLFAFFLLFRKKIS